MANSLRPNGAPGRRLANPLQYTTAQDDALDSAYDQASKLRQAALTEGIRALKAGQITHAGLAAMRQEADAQGRRLVREAQMAPVTAREAN